MGIRSQAENLSMVVSSQNIKLWSIKCLYTLPGKWPNSIFSFWLYFWTISIHYCW